MEVRIGIVVSSDRAARGEYEDRGGVAISAALDDYLSGSWQKVYFLIPDDRATIEAALVRCVEEEGCCLVITTGGTGPAKRDVTPEATEAVCEKLLPGFGELMRARSVDKVPTAILSRQTAGVRGGCLIINLPGSPKAIRECLDAVFPAVPDCIDLIGGPRLETDPEVVQAYRPHSP